MSMMWVGIGSAVASAGTSLYLGGKAEDAARDASRVAADAETRALNYQQDVERLPLGYRDAALQGLGGEYGLTLDQEGNVISDGSTIDDRVASSPFYTGMLESGRGEIGRAASATGRLRGGATPAMLGQNAQSAYMNAYNQQLQGLGSFAKTPLNTNAIAGTMSGIGNIKAQGDIAAAQARQQGYQGAFDAIGSGINAYGRSRL